MRRFGIVVHRERAEAASLATAAATWLEAAGHSVAFPEADAATAGRPDLGVEAGTFGRDLDVAVSIGGDGTMLRAVDMVARFGVPVIGVNVGQLGYLTEVDPAQWQDALTRWLDGRSGLDHRMLLNVRVESASGADRVVEATALNEAVVEKTPMGHTVRIEVSLDHEFFTPYMADGLIVATPTGSTAYAFSARGPIVAPRHRALLLTPVSPHMLFDRTLVLEPTTEVRLRVSGHRPATLSVDGRNLGELAEGDTVVCSAAAYDAQLVTYGDRDFHQILKAKFGLEDR